MLVQFDFECGSGVSMHLLNRVRVVVQFHFVVWTNTCVQFCN